MVIRAEARGAYPDHEEPLGIIRGCPGFFVEALLETGSLGKSGLPS